MKKFLALALALVMVLSLSACGKGEYAGTYELTEMSMEGFDLKAGDALWNQVFTDDVPVFNIVLDKDTFKMNLNEGNEVEGEYKVSGDTITLSAKGDDFDGTINDGKITIEYDGSKMVFEKK